MSRRPTRRSYHWSLLLSLVVLPIVALIQSTHALVFNVVLHGRLLVLGAGRVGQEVMEQTIVHSDATGSRFDQVDGVSRSTIPNNSSSNKNMNILDWSDTTTLADKVQHCTHLLVTLPPNPATRSLCQEKILPHLNNKNTALQWIGIISTTSVYGDHQGGWVTEDSQCLLNENDGAASKALNYLAWEQEWIDYCHHLSSTLTIFRCAGIYGPAASALHTIRRMGLPTKKTDDNNDVTNRIHIHDLAAAIVQSMLLTTTKQPPKPVPTLATDHRTRVPPMPQGSYQVYNLADNLPASRAAVFRYAAQLWYDGVLPEAPQQHNNSTAATAVPSRRRGEKRVSNRRMRRDLLPELRYPTYQEGLQHVLRSMRHG